MKLPDPRPVCLHDVNTANSTLHTKYFDKLRIRIKILDFLYNFWGRLLRFKLSNTAELELREMVQSTVGWGDMLS